MSNAIRMRQIFPDPDMETSGKKITEGPRMCMKTKDEKSDNLKGPTML